MSEDTIITTEEAPSDVITEAGTVIAASSDTPAFSAKWDASVLLENAPEDIDKEKFKNWITKTQDPFAAFKSNLHAEKKISEYANADKLLDPSKKDELKRALGVPEEAKAYEFDPELKVSKDDIEGLQATAHRLGLDKAGANEMAKVVNEIKQKAAEFESERNAIKEEQTVGYLESIWGNHQTEAYQNNLNLVVDVLQSRGIDPESEDASAILRNGKAVELLNELGKMMDQDSLPRVKAGSLDTAKTLEAEFRNINQQIQIANEKGDQRTARELEPKRRSAHAKLMRARG